MTSTPDSGLARRGRGRSPRLTRDLIITATAELLRTEPNTAPTMARVAEAVRASPMALYRHFRDRDDLLLAVARHVFTSPVARIPKRANWQRQLRAWMLENYQQARAYPQLMQLAFGGDAAVWLSDAAALVGILQYAGVPPEAMAAALYWTSTTTLGHCLVAASTPSELPTAQLYAGLGRLPDAEAALLAPILPNLPRTPDDAFELIIEATIASIAYFIPPTPSADPPPTTLVET
jgi:TetR/AcrR family tetracycline transcriptional repressor